MIGCWVQAVEWINDILHPPIHTYIHTSSPAHNIIKPPTQHVVVGRLGNSRPGTRVHFFFKKCTLVHVNLSWTRAHFAWTKTHFLNFTILTRSERHFLYPKLSMGRPTVFWKICFVNIALEMLKTFWMVIFFTYLRARFFGKYVWPVKFNLKVHGLVFVFHGLQF